MIDEVHSPSSAGVLQSRCLWSFCTEGFRRVTQSHKLGPEKRVAMGTARTVLMHELNKQHDLWPPLARNRSKMEASG